MKNDEKQRKKQWKTMKNRETRMNNDKTKTMKNDEQEKKNNEKWWKREEKTMNNDEIVEK
jgi:hypothetical protein